MKNTMFAVITLAILVTGCGEKPKDTPVAPTSAPASVEVTPTEARSVEWYKANPSEAEDQLSKCKALHHQEAMQNADCNNANHAKASNTWSARGGAIKIKPLSADDLKAK